MKLRERTLDCWRKVASLLRGVVTDRRGGMAVFMALAAVPLVGAGGLAVDSTRGYLLKARLSQALDAAGLAGGRAYYSATRDQDIQQFFDANIPQGFMGATIGEVTITPDEDAGTLDLEVTAEMNTTLVRVLGIDTLTVGAYAKVRRSDRGLELTLVMDNTGSMKGSKINDMKAAATEMINIIFKDRETVSKLHVSLVPYTAAVNIGSWRTNWLLPNELCIAGPPFSAPAVWGMECQDPADVTAIPRSNPTVGQPAYKDYVGTSWKGCVEARYGANNRDVTDDPPSVEAFRAFFYPHNEHDHDNDLTRDTAPIGNRILDETAATNTNNNNGKGPNLGCGPAITPLVSSKSQLLAAIAAMGPWHRGGTQTNEGLAWGWRTISPRWRGLWGGDTPPDLPTDYDDPLVNKVAVILTDGANQYYNHADVMGDPPPLSDYSAFRRVEDGHLGTTTSLSIARTNLNNKTLAICNAMKAEGITIYTILFAVPNNAEGTAIRNVFRSCASNSAFYFDNPDGTTLRQTFRTIANQLSNLRLAE